MDATFCLRLRMVVLDTPNSSDLGSTLASHRYIVWLAPSHSQPCSGWLRVGVLALLPWRQSRSALPHFHYYLLRARRLGTFRSLFRVGNLLDSDCVNHLFYWPARVLLSDVSLSLIKVSR